MKFTRKNIVFSIVLLMGILLSYSIYLQQSKISISIELSSENNSTSNCFNPDSETDEEDLITSKREIPTAVGVKNKLTKHTVSCQLYRPSFTIWQPPKIS